MNDMIDVHTHIIPGVDDGSDDIEMSLQMLRSIVRQGCGRVFATPHSGYAFYRYHTRALDSFRRLQEAVKKAEIPVEIYLGCEIYTTRDKIKDNLLRLRCNQFPSFVPRLRGAFFAGRAAFFGFGRYCSFSN